MLTLGTRPAMSISQIAHIRQGETMRLALFSMSTCTFKGQELQIIANTTANPANSGQRLGYEIRPIWLLLIFFTWFTSLSVFPQNCAGHATLNTFERVQFIQVSRGMRSDVVAQYLSAPGCGHAMLDELRKLGATVDYADEKSGFAWVSIPRETLLASLDSPGVEYAYTRYDDPIYYRDPDAKNPQSERTSEPVPAIKIPYPRVANILSPDGPFFAASDIGLTELWKEHPDADGRGVRVAVLDNGFDLLHPALQEARNAAGDPVPKVVEIGSLDGPEDDASWVQMGELIESNDGTLTAAGRTWHIPTDGTYRLGIYKNELTLGPSSNSHVRKLDFAVGVLWDQAAGKVWVDTDGDGSFANQRALGDYSATHQIDWFGSKSGTEDNRIPFAVKIDEVHEAVYIRIGGEHGALVAGPLAANTWTGGLYDGSAPSAQLVDEGLHRAPLVAAMVKMFAQPDVDVINRSGGIGRAGYTGLREGIEDFAQHAIEREISVYNKPIVAYGAAAGMVHVNDYASADALKRNRQLGPPYKDTINSFVWDMTNGIMNTILAPSVNLETESRYDPLDLPAPNGRKSSFSQTNYDPPAPDGYVIGSNNSPTIPVVSGVLADLISEARLEHVRFDAARLDAALFTGARLLNGFPVSQQGYGLVNAARSWDQLVKMARADDPANPELTSFSIARDLDGKKIEVQGFNQSIDKPWTKIEGEIWITRHGGYAGDRQYTFGLRGDHRSFELLDHEATLSQGKPVRVRFRALGAPGWNIALLDLRDVKADVVMGDVPLEVKAPELGREVAPGVVRFTSKILPLTSESHFLEVGSDVQAVRYEIRAPYVGPASILYAPGIRSRDVMPPGEPIDPVHHVGPMETLESLVINSEPGIQEIYWENRGRPEYMTPYDPPATDAPRHVELTVTRFTVGIEREDDKLILKNLQAAIDGRAELYDATLKMQSLSGAGLHAMGEVERVLPDHLAEWRLRVTAVSTMEGPADVYVFNCAGKNGCYVAAQQEIVDSGKTLVIEHPAAGAWKIVVRSRNQEQKPVTYSIREATLVPAAIPIEAANSQHPSGASWALPLPMKQSNAQYAAFLIAGTPGVESEKSGLVIAMTPLDRDAP